MTPDKTELARRAVACKGWRWMPGMRLACGIRVWAVEGDTYSGVHEHDGALCNHAFDEHDLPDLDDPATLGCLLGLVREAWGEVVDIEEYYTHQGCKPGERRREFAVTVHCTDTAVFDGGSLGEAFVAALEAAP